MVTAELTTRKKQLLEVVIRLYRESESPVTSTEIADAIDRKPGTIRNQMPGLRSLGLVESITGPKGGYKPTAETYDVLDIEKSERTTDVIFEHNGEPVETATVEEIDLISIHNPELCRAEIRLQESVYPYRNGDTITVGPTPISQLVIEGTIIGKATPNNSIIIDIHEMRAPGKNKQRLSATP